MTRKTLLRNVTHPFQALDEWWAEVSPERRLDRNAANICMLIGLMCPSLVILLFGPAKSSAVDQMPVFLQVWMCGFIFFGCLIKLHGAASGTRFWFPNSHLKVCYSWGFIGAPIASSGLGVYAYYIFNATPDFLAVLGAILTPALGLGISLQAFLYWLEWRRIDRVEDQLIKQAKAEVEDNERDSMG